MRNWLRHRRTLPGEPMSGDGATLCRPSGQGSGQVLSLRTAGIPNTKQRSLPAVLKRKAPAPRSFAQCLARRASQSSVNSCMKRTVPAIGLHAIQMAVLLRCAGIAPAPGPPDPPDPVLGAEVRVIAERSGGERRAGRSRWCRFAGHPAYERRSRISASMSCRCRRASNAVSMSTSTKRVSVWG